MSIASEVKESVTMWDALDILDIDYHPSATGQVFIHAWTREEATPSVHVEDTVWYDFGDGEGGDVIAFVRSYMGCSFGQALAILSRVAGVNQVAGRTVPPRKPKEILDLTERVDRESRPIQRDDEWLLSKLREKHGLAFTTVQRWGLRVGPGDALWMPHYRWHHTDREPAPITGVKVRDYRSGRRQAIKGSSFTGFYAIPNFRRTFVGAIIVEGESDAWAASEIWDSWLILGLPAGAGKFDAEWLDGINVPIYVCLDSDPAGQNAQARIVAEVGAIPIAVPEEFNDVCEAFMHGATMADFDRATP